MRGKVVLFDGDGGTIKPFGEDEKYSFTIQDVILNADNLKRGAVVDFDFDGTRAIDIVPRPSLPLLL